MDSLFNPIPYLGRLASSLALPHWYQRLFDLPQLIKWSKIPRGSKVLEIGCSTGRNALFLSKALKAREYMAVDRDSHAIAEAEASLSGDTHVIFQVADATRLPFHDNSFDAVIEIELLHHLPDWKKVIREMHRVLKKNGKLMLKDYSIETFTLPGLGLLFQRFFEHPYDFMFDQVEFLTYLRKNGFEILHQTDNTVSFALVAVCQK